MNDKELKNAQLKDLLAMYYQAAQEQPKLFETKEDPEFKELKKFRKLINKEAKKRNIKPLKLIEYFAENKEELIGLLEKKKITHPKFSKIYEHAEIENITHQLFKTQKLKDKGRQIVNIPIIGGGSITGEVMVWESKGVEYFVRADDILKLEDKNPKAFVSQIKNISLLMGFAQEQHFDNSTKEAKCEFTFPYYVERRGYSKEEIVKGGNFLKELRRDLFSGAYTTYRIDKIIIEGKEYTAHGIPNFYILYEPKDYKNEWKVDFNNPYSSWIIKILKGEAEQYFIKNPKAIEDRKTTERPYLFLFYIQLIRRMRKELITKTVKIGDLLKDMKIDKQILARPKECFNLLKECLIYFSTHYEPIPEIESFKISSVSNEIEMVKLPSYVGLKAMGIKDIREAYISFKRPYKRGKEEKLNEEENHILERTLKWFDGQINKIPREDQESMIKMYIKKLGYEYFAELFEKEANKINANAVEFLTKVLPSKLKEIKEDPNC